MTSGISHQQNTHEYRRITLVTYTAICGVQVLSGLRQSMPSMSIESCARVSETVPSFACGQMKRPRSRRLANKHRPSSSAHKILIVSPAPAKNKDVSGERLLVEHGLHLRTQTVEATTHVGHAGCKPDLRPGSKFNHLRKLSRIERSNIGSAPRSTLIMARPGNSI